MDLKYPTGPTKGLIEQMSNLQQFKTRNFSRFNTLTDREVDVLTLIADGLQNPQIAEKLGISRNTVQNHRASIKDKLGISDQTEYIKYAFAYDLIQF